MVLTLFPHSHSKDVWFSQGNIWLIWVLKLIISKAWTFLLPDISLLLFYFFMYWPGQSLLHFPVYYVVFWHLQTASLNILNPSFPLNIFFLPVTISAGNTLVVQEYLSNTESWHWLKLHHIWKAWAEISWAQKVLNTPEATSVLPGPLTCVQPERERPCLCMKTGFTAEQRFPKERESVLKLVPFPSGCTHIPLIKAALTRWAGRQTPATRG